MSDRHPLDIVFYHVGGFGGYGPIDAVLNSRFGRYSTVVVFEARDSKDDLTIQEEYRDKGIRTLLVPRCVSDSAGSQRFYVNRQRPSSGLFPCADDARSEHVLYDLPGVVTWGDNTEVDSVIQVTSVTLDEFIKDNSIPPPDVLSMDAQGAELRIMKGAEAAFASVVGVVTEVEFFEIYKGQNLFHEQFDFLRTRGFRLADILNQQSWHPASAAGLGFLTVGEALFLRDLNAYLIKSMPKDEKQMYQLIKLAAVACCFERYSYVYRVVDHVLAVYEREAESIMQETPPFRVLLRLHAYMKRHQEDYGKDVFFFMRRTETLRNIVCESSSTKRSGRKMEFVRLCREYARALEKALRRRVKSGRVYRMIKTEDKDVV